LENPIDLKSSLKFFFGFSSFKDLQEPIIENLLLNKNTFVLMPTGGGKSLCYQLPAMILKGTALVISPLIALMKNQVDAIRGLSTNDGVAHVLNSSLNKTETRLVKSDLVSGITKILYIAPESLAKKDTIDFLKKIKISFLAIDEAHCISEWGHDFRPEYRNLRLFIDQINQKTPIIALTATATPKVQDDIIKNLKITDANIFKSSFNRPNLYYEVRTKTSQVDFDIIKFIKGNSGKSGIVYCLARKTVEELAKALQVNGIKALPYHAGLDSKTRVINQDKFLNEDCDVIVATIAFGMGIDKPDVRFVIHHDIPKSIESYYQETGRAGRDGGEGHCLAFYSYKDIEKLEKFMSGKPIAEQEVAFALLNDMVAYAETSISRRKFILHYFGEKYSAKNDDEAKMDDNMRFPKNKKEVGGQLKSLIKIISETKEKYKSKEIVRTLVGEKNALILSHKTHEKSFFGLGKDKSNKFWMALLRQALVFGFFEKEIETYGVIKLTSKALEFKKNGTSFMMTEDHNHEDLNPNPISSKAQGTSDKVLMNFLMALRKKVAQESDVPPFAVFQEYSLEDMALKYPINIQEMSNINGVGEGKARRYGNTFIDLISNYVEENDITRPDDLIIKSTGSNSALKLYLIQSVDRKLSLEDIASAKAMEMSILITEMETIVFSGTKLNIDYWIREIFDEDQIDELMNYFMEADTDDISIAYNEFNNEYEEDDLRLFRLKFISEVGN
jgi:ATP-dependent DNA helicase RecQ